MQLSMTLGCHGVLRGLGQLEGLLSGVTERLAALDRADAWVAEAPQPDEEPLQIMHELLADEARREAELAAREAERKRAAHRRRGVVPVGLTLLGGAELELRLGAQPEEPGYVLLPLCFEAAGTRAKVPLTLRLACDD